MEEKRRHKRGRPSVITQDTIDKLEHAYIIGATHAEAALAAGISESALYKHLASDPALKERVEPLRKMPVLKAKQTLYDDIERGDGVAARWLLERRASEEYTVKSEVAVSTAGSLTIDDRSAALRDFLRRFE